jgi:L-fucose isomerase-like protein
MQIENRRDSFCGKLSVCSNLNQYGIRFTNTSTHTCEIGSERFSEDIRRFDAVCRVVGGLKGARFAQLGTRPTPFQTVRYSEKLLQASGITIVPIDMSEIIAEAGRMGTSAKVAERVTEIRAYGTVPSCIQEEQIVREAKLALTMERLVRDHGCVAGAAQCWDSIQKNYGCAVCLPLSMMNEKGIIMGCETDITGAIAMYAMYLASGQPSGYLDWNNNYLDDRDKCVCLHCSAFPKSFIGREFEISPTDVLGETLGRDNCFGACKGNVAKGPMTFAKVSTDDTKGRIKAYFGEGEFTDDPITTAGSVAVCKIANLQKLMDYICRNGFEHHIAMNRSNCAGILEEAFSNYMGWEVYHHK